MNKAYAEDVLRESLIRDVVLNQERFALAVLVADGTELLHKVTRRVQVPLLPSVDGSDDALSIQLRCSTGVDEDVRNDTRRRDEIDASPVHVSVDRLDCADITASGRASVRTSSETGEGGMVSLTELFVWSVAGAGEMMPREEKLCIRFPAAFYDPDNFAGWLLGPLKSRVRGILRLACFLFCLFFLLQ